MIFNIVGKINIHKGITNYQHVYFTIENNIKFEKKNPQIKHNPTI